MNDEKDCVDRDEGSNRRAAQDERIVAALAEGLTYAQAGALAKVSDRTVARRMSVPGFARGSLNAETNRW